MDNQPVGPTDASTRYLLARLADIGETGWVPDDAHPITLRKGDEVIEYIYRFNGGSPAWFCSESPKRLRDLLPPPFRSVVKVPW